MPEIKKCKHKWSLGDSKIFCLVCRESQKIDDKNIRTLSMGVGVQTCYLLLRFYERYDVIIHADIANDDREHGEYDITYWILDNIVKPFCDEKGLPLWIISHPKGGVYHRSLDEKKIPMVHPRWCTQDHKIDLMTKSIRKGLNANFPENVVISDIGFSSDESTRMDNSGSKVKYNVLDYPLINMKITRNECVEWLNKNYPIVMNGNKVDWKEAKSGCWFCPFWRVSKLKQLPMNKKQEMIKLEENSAYHKTFKKKPMKIILGLDSHTLMEWSDDDELNDDTACNSGHCFV